MAEAMPPPPKQRSRRSGSSSSAARALTAPADFSAAAAAAAATVGRPQPQRRSAAAKPPQPQPQSPLISPRSPQSPLPPALSPLVSPQLRARAGYYTPPSRAHVRWDPQPPLFGELRALLWRAAAEELELAGQAGGGGQSRVFEEDCVSAFHPLPLQLQ